MCDCFLALRNISKLPLSFSLKCGNPFTIDCASMQLDVDEGATVNVMVDPGFKGDLQSIVVAQKLRVDYIDNPQKDAIDLVASIDFPNLSFESTKVEFGSCLSDTTRRVPVQVTNCSAVDVVYNWAWEADSLQEDVSNFRVIGGCVLYQSYAVTTTLLNSTSLSSLSLLVVFFHSPSG